MLKDHFYGNQKLCKKHMTIYFLTTRTFSMNYEQKIFTVHKNHNFLDKTRKMTKKIF